ncbi:MAG: peptidoglycan-binding protein [Oscillospiraceae bacterium]|nr:peptidoglycan-binding protein [Oscillospiraceae bacterium]
MANQIRDLNTLHPKMRDLALKFLDECKKQGMSVLIYETLRSQAYQDALYAQGRTKPGKIVTNATGAGMSSYHMWGLAFDFCQNVPGNMYPADFMKKGGAIGKKLGLVWGGDFKSIVDTPHFEFRALGDISSLKTRYGTLDALKKTWPGTAATVPAAPPSTTKTHASPLNAPAKIPVTIKRGSKGENVKLLQRELNKRGAVLKVDGDFGPKTDAAVRAYQKKQGLVVDGVVGEKTWKRLLG